MYKKIFTFTCFFSALWMTGAFAGGGTRADNLREAWGAQSDVHGGARHMYEDDDACIGPSATKNCKPKQYKAMQWDDEHSFHMMLAMQINENGAYFCPIQINGRNENKEASWTTYQKMGKESDCVWLCKPGHGGRGCQNDAGTSCDPTLLLRDNYKDLKNINNRNVANVEENIPMFWWNRVPDKRQESDVVLAITTWLPSGHGAWVRPIGVRAVRDGWKHMVSWIEIYDTKESEEILVCKDGYTVENNDCVEVNPDACTAASACPGWAGFDKSQHTWLPVPNPAKNNETCFEYRCAADGYAFTSLTNRTCAPCPTQLRQGESPRDGTCIRCDGTDVYNANLESSGYCGPALVLTKNDMQYGYTKTRNSGVKLGDQCWTMIMPDEYLKCVMLGTPVVSRVQTNASNDDNRSSDTPGSSSGGAGNGGTGGQIPGGGFGGGSGFGGAGVGTGVGRMPGVDGLGKNGAGNGNMTEHAVSFTIDTKY